MSKVLGLDLGTNSIGWALIDDKQNNILGIGSRIFPEGVENLGDGKNEISKNASRTVARGTRRQFFRRRLRKRYLLRKLAENKFCPIVSDKIKIWNTKEVFNDETLKQWLKLNPYELRAKAIREQLTLHELGRVFYHMIQRRGFQSNSRSAGSDENEKSVIFKGDVKIGKIGITETQEKIEEKTTLGAYLSEIQPKEFEPYHANLERIRNRYTTRKMYIDEFETIWEKQKEYNPILTDELKTIFGGRKKDGHADDGVLFHQRPLRSQKHLVGKCTFEPKKTKCPISAIPFEEFRVYQWVNTVECNGKKLNETEREVLAKELFKKEKPNFMALRKAIKKADSAFQFNYKDDDKIVGTYTISNLSNNKFFGAAWFDFTEKEQEDIWHVLYFFEDREKLKQYAIANWGFNEEKAEKISKFNLKDGYANLSRKAINNILPFLKLSFTYDIAVVLGGIKNVFGDDWDRLEESQRNLIIDNMFDIVRQGKKGGFIDGLKEFLKEDFQLTDKQLSKLYHHSASIEATEILAKLPLGKLADKEIQSIKNPIVVTALFEIRKLVNEIIEDYGKPNEIKVEMARDLKISKTKRNEIRRDQKLNEAYNDYVVGRLREHNQIISHDTILKYKLWKECNKTCPYTGKSISVEQLFSGEVQIEHILPWSRSLNDSYMNKTLCFADENRAKGDKTPYEFYFEGQGEQKWEQIKAQALNCFKDKTIEIGRAYKIKAYNKFKQFVKTKLDDDFISRQLNDTRYISKEAKNYLSKICENVQVSPGQMTAKLRHDWGLNSILNEDNKKSRDDHRHHAVDALVMTCSTRSHLQKLSDLNKKRQLRSHKTESVAYPSNWESFRQDAEKAVNQILVSHKKTYNVLTIRTTKVKKNGEEYKNVGIAARGQLHKEFVYGKRQAPNSEGAYHIRKPIESLTTNKHVEKVVDPVIRELITKRVEELGGFEKGKNIPKDTFYVVDKDGLVLPQIFLPNKNGEPVPIKKVRMKENIGGAEKLKDINQYVNPRSNHHVLVYKTEKNEFSSRVVSFWEAVERKKQKQDLIQLPIEHRNGEIINTLQINDMYLLGLKEKDIDWTNLDGSKMNEYLYKVQKTSKKPNLTMKEVCFRKAVDSRSDKEASKDYIYIKGFGDGKTGWQTFNPIKVKISSTGKIIKI